MNTPNLIYLLFFSLLLSCGPQRPDNELTYLLVETINDLSQRNTERDLDKLYKLLSVECKESFSAEVKMARTLDSVSIAQLPLSRRLRVLSLRNAMAEELRYNASEERIFKKWYAQATMSFPLHGPTTYYYTPDIQLEEDLLSDGISQPMISIVKEGNTLRADIFHNAEVQQKRLDNILQSHEIDDVFLQAVWLGQPKTDPISWNPI